MENIHYVVRIEKNKPFTGMPCIFAKFDNELYEFSSEDTFGNYGIDPIGQREYMYDATREPTEQEKNSDDVKKVILMFKDTMKRYADCFFTECKEFV